MRRLVLSMGAATLAIAGATYGATSVTNTYTVHAVIGPTKSGTDAKPKPSEVQLTWDVGGRPSPSRPANVRRYTISLEGLREHTNVFPSCAAITLNDVGPNSCLPGSLIGGGRFMVEAGPSGVSDSNYNADCRAELSIYNGGRHNLTLWIYQGSQRPGQPGPCPIPNGGGVAINDRITTSKDGITEHFRFPMKLLHVSSGVDSTVVGALLRIPPHKRLIRRYVRGRSVGEAVGLLESVFCPSDHQRRVRVTFTREDGISDARTTLVPCT